MVLELNQFTYDVYVKLLKHLQNNYRLLMAKEEVREDIPTVVMRHDVDWNLESARRMATIENNIGVQSSYFVLLTCPTYNLFSEYGIELVREIQDLGHEIGLHYDIVVYKMLGHGINFFRALKREVDSLETILGGTKVLSIACHNPSVLEFDPLKNVYLRNVSDLSQFSNYVSDSNRLWREDNLMALLDGKYKRNLLVTHPGAWTEEYIEDRYESVDNSISRIRDLWVELWREKDARSK